MKNKSEIVIKIKFNLSFWDCLKLRLSGLYDKLENLDTVGDVSCLKFKQSVK